MKFEPGLPGLSDRSHVLGDDDRSPETRSREELSEFEPSTHYKKVDVQGASLDVIGERRKAIIEERWKAKEERRKAKEERRNAKEERRKAREEQARVRAEQAKAREEQAKAFEVEMNSHKRSDFHGSLAKPLKMEREEADPNVFYGELSVGGLKVPFSEIKSEDGLQDLAREPFSEIESEDGLQDLARKPVSEIESEASLQDLTRELFSEIESEDGLQDLARGPFSEIESEDSLQDLAGDTTVATGPVTKHDWIDSLLSKLSVRGVFSQLLRQSPPTGIRRWSFKSTLSAIGLGECLLEGGKTRVRWRCVCGRKMYDDFIELRPGAATDLEKWLNHSIRDNAVNRASSPSQDYTLSLSTSSSAGASRQQQTAGSDISLQPLSWTASAMPDSGQNGAVTIDVHLEKCWLLICGQPRRGPDSLLAQLDLSSRPSDKELFDGMKELHSSLRNTFALQPVLKGVQTIRFVQASF